MSGQLPDLPLFGRSLDVLLPLKRAMAEALKASRLSREQVLDRLNALLTAEGLSWRVTLNTLEKWVAPSAAHVIPVHLLPAFCRAVESAAPLQALAAPLGAVVAGPREQALMDLGEAQMQQKSLARKRRQALDLLEGMKS